MNKTYQQLKNKIIKEIPEIMELTFGCRVLFENEEYLLSTYDCFGDDAIRARLHKKGHNLTLDYTNNGGFYKGVKIIGRDITLSDCLRVLKSGTKEEPKVKIAGIYFNATERLLSIWDLTKNSLHQQKPEVWEFLNNLID